MTNVKQFQVYVKEGAVSIQLVLSDASVQKARKEIQRPISARIEMNVRTQMCVKMGIVLTRMVDTTVSATEDSFQVKTGRGALVGFYIYE